MVAGYLLIDFSISYYFCMLSSKYFKRSS